MLAVLVCYEKKGDYGPLKGYYPGSVRSELAQGLWMDLNVNMGPISGQGENHIQVKQSKIDMLTTEYEPFEMKEDESIQDMHTRFTSIINELHSFGSWESKVNAITEAKDLQNLTIDELIGNLKTYEMKRKKDLKKREPKKEKNMVLKVANKDSSSDESDMEYLTLRFQKMIRKNGGIPKKRSSSRNFDKEYLKVANKDSSSDKSDMEYLTRRFQKKKMIAAISDHYKTNTKKATKRNQVHDRKFKRRDVADNMVKQALVDWENSSSESEGENMMVADNGSSEYESIFALMAKSDDDEDNEEDEVSFLDVQRNLKTYSKKKLMPLENVFIDAYHSLINEKNSLVEEIGGIEQERDYMVASIINLEETIESLKKEKEVLTKSNANIEHERDDLLVVVVNLKETIGELKMKSRPENSQKGKEVASETHIKLESELNSVKSSLCAELDKNKQLQEELGRVKSDLEKSLKWTWSSDAITALYTNNGRNRQGIGFQREKTPYNPYSKYVIVPDNWLCTHCGNTGHFKKNCKARIQSQQKNKVFAEKVTVATEPGPPHKNGTMKESSLQWYMDSSYSKHMTGRSHNKEYEDGEFTNAPGKAIDIANGKTDLMSQVKQKDEGDAIESPKGIEDPGDSFDLVGYVDADYVEYLVDKNSIFGTAHFLGSYFISWGTKKQTVWLFLLLKLICDQYFAFAKVDCLYEVLEDGGPCSIHLHQGTDQGTI
ncbi:uncharacterized protein [Nicotiana sylvestris]|uniref:uncharacterized protein n=1 Tax=Nicotiana sylvestris TaxID=4096 RepID=UPI00388C8DB3